MPSNSLEDSDKVIGIKNCACRLVSTNAGKNSAKLVKKAKKTGRNRAVQASQISSNRRFRHLDCVTPALLCNLPSATGLRRLKWVGRVIAFRYAACPDYPGSAIKPDEQIIAPQSQRLFWQCRHVERPPSFRQPWHRQRPDRRRDAGRFRDFLPARLLKRFPMPSGRR